LKSRHNLKEEETLFAPNRLWLCGGQEEINFPVGGKKEIKQKAFVRA